MAGWRGHRGSVYYLAVAPGHQQMSWAPDGGGGTIAGAGLFKVNVLVRTSNASVLSCDKLHARDDAFSLVRLNPLIKLGMV